MTTIKATTTAKANTGILRCAQNDKQKGNGNGNGIRIGNSRFLPFDFAQGAE
jgi:hypothetical protein